LNPSASPPLHATDPAEQYVAQWLLAALSVGANLDARRALLDGRHAPLRTREVGSSSPMRVNIGYLYSYAVKPEGKVGRRIIGLTGQASGVNREMDISGEDVC
jgi:hypothetical protein